MLPWHKLLLKPQNLEASDGFFGLKIVS